MRQAYKPADVPTRPHFAALIFESKSETYWSPDYTPGRTSAGGSYDSREVKTTEYWYTDSEKDLCDWLRGIKLEGMPKKSYVLMKIEGQLAAEVKVSLALQPAGPDPNNHDDNPLRR